MTRRRFLAASGGFFFRAGIKPARDQGARTIDPEMKPALFRCPTTGAMVQHMIATEADPGDHDRYDAVHCLACSLQHLINRVTGKALGQRDEA